MIEVLKQMYQMLLTEPYAPAVCDQLEVILRQAIKEWESQEPVAWTLLLTGEHTGMVGMAGEKFVGAPDYYQRVNVYTTPPQRTWVGSGDLEDSNAYLTHPPQPAPVPLTDEQIDVLREYKSKGWGAGWSFDFKGFARAIEAAHGIGENT